MDHVSSGNLPQSWLIATPDVTFINARLPRASTNLTIRVPEGTEPGVYSGMLFSKAMAAHDVADSGRGLHIAVTVPSDCLEVARFEVVLVSPQLLWPPNHSMEEVTVSGRVVLPDGCSLNAVGYSIDDEYGTHTSMGEITLETDQSFSVAIPVESWRDGNDMDGRHYAITLYAENEVGIGTSGPYTVLVPHDMRGKKKSPSHTQ